MLLEIKDPHIVRILNILNIRNVNIRQGIALIEELFERMSRHHMFLIAAGIAFNILLYLIPLLLVIVYVISSFYSVNDISSFLSNSFNEILPPGPQSRALLEGTIKEVSSIFTKSGAVGIIGIGALLWLSSILLGSLRTGLNAIFHLPSTRNFIIYKIRDIFLTILILVMVLITIYILPMLTIVNSSLHSFIPTYFAPYFSRLYIISASLIASFILFYLLFRFAPNKRLNRGVRLYATFFCVIFVEISRHAFSYYISGASSYGKFYGAYAIIASMAVWLYYLTLIILLSAELSQLIYEARIERKKIKLHSKLSEI
jgi:membrane protein